MDFVKTHHPHCATPQPPPHLPQLQALRWPNNARVALGVVPNIEHYESQPKYVRTRTPGHVGEFAIKIKYMNAQVPSAVLDPAYDGTLLMLLQSDNYIP